MIDIRTPSGDELKRVLFDPWVWDRISEDFAPAQDQIGEIPPARWFVAYADGVPCGYAATHATEDGEKLHFAMLPAYRMRAREFLRGVLDRVGKVYCEIPVCYPELINFARKGGFVPVGEYGTYLKHGVRHKRIRLCRS